VTPDPWTDEQARAWWDQHLPQGEVTKLKELRS
jgi:hypothetical protein